jgi:formate/nitrite transporter FocA (FNT family)
MEYLIWNEIPTALGNLFGGFLLVGLPLYLTHVKESKARKAADSMKPVAAL